MLSLQRKYELFIGYPLPTDKWQISRLWQDSFDDPIEYIDFFFNHVYKPENTLVVKRNGYVVSALQMIPYKAKLAKNTIPIAYICGACTHLSERGQGFMKALIHLAKEELRRRGFILAIVIPAEYSLFDFYQDQEFTHEIFHDVERMSFKDTMSTEHTYTFEEGSKKHFPYFDRKQYKRFRTILHDENDFEAILQELNCLDGKVFVALHHHIPVGIAFVEKIAKNEILIKEMMTDNEDVKTALRQYALKTFEAQYVTTHYPPRRRNRSIKSKYGLVCFLNKRKRHLFLLSMSLMHD